MTDTPATTGPCDYPTCSARGAGHPLACKCSAQPATAERLWCMEIGSPVYEACVTVIAASRSGEKTDVTRDEVEDFWARVQALEIANG